MFSSSQGRCHIRIVSKSKVPAYFQTIERFVSFFFPIASSLPKQRVATLLVLLLSLLSHFFKERFSFSPTSVFLGSGCKGKRFCNTIQIYLKLFCNFHQSFPLSLQLKTLHLFIYRGLGTNGIKKIASPIEITTDILDITKYKHKKNGNRSPLSFNYILISFSFRISGASKETS